MTLPLTDIEAPLARRAERLVAWIRVVGGAIAIALTLSEADVHPAPMYAIEQATYLAIVAVGVTSLVLLPRLDTRRTERLIRLTFVADALLMGAVEPTNAWVTDVLSSPVGVLLPVIGGLKFGVRGAWLGTGAFALSQTVYELLRTQVFGSPHSIENSVAVVVIGAVLGAMAGRLATDARQALRGAANRHAELDDARRQLTVMHDTILAGFGGDAATVVRRMLDRLEHVPLRQVLLRDGDELRWVAGTPEPLVTDLTVEALERIHRERAPAVHLPPPGAASEGQLGFAVAAIRGRDGVLGALVLGGRLRPGDDVGDALRSMQTLADQMALAIEAARAFESEAEVAARYQELDRLKTEFIALASHELRTPLTAINGFAETLDRLGSVDADEISQRLLEGIRRQGHRLEQLIDDLTVIGDLGRQHVALELGPVDVERTVHEVVAGCLPRTDVEVACAPDSRVLADRRQLRVCLEHLVENAQLYGTPPVSIRTEHAGDRLRILVTDAGGGIPRDRRDHVFEPFGVARNVLAHQRGSGLGLAIVKRLVLAMEGTVDIVDDDRCTTFAIELPAARHRSEVSPGSTSRSSAGTASSTSSP